MEMVTRKLSFGFNVIEDCKGREYGSLVTWVRELICATSNGGAGRLEEIMDPRVDLHMTRLIWNCLLGCLCNVMLLRHEHDTELLLS